MTTSITVRAVPEKVRNELARRAVAAEAFRTFTDLSINIWSWSAISHLTWNLADNLSSYDAARVAVALEADATLLTSDARIARAPWLKARINDA